MGNHIYGEKVRFGAPKPRNLPALALQFLQAQLRLYSEGWVGLRRGSDGQHSHCRTPQLWVPQIAFLGWDDKLHPKDPLLP